MNDLKIDIIDTHQIIILEIVNSQKFMFGKKRSNNDAVLFRERKECPLAPL